MPGRSGCRKADRQPERRVPDRLPVRPGMRPVGPLQSGAAEQMPDPPPRDDRPQPRLGTPCGGLLGLPRGNARGLRRAGGRLGRPGVGSGRRRTAPPPDGAELRARPEQAGPDGADGHVQSVGGVLVAAPLDGDDLDQPAVHGRQMLHRLAHLPQHDVRFLDGFGGGGVVGQVGALDAPLPLVAGEMQVLEDGGQPGREVGAGFELVAVAQGALHAVLHEILGFRGVAGQPAGEARQVGDASYEFLVEIERHDALLVWSAQSFGRFGVMGVS